VSLDRENREELDRLAGHLVWDPSYLARMRWEEEHIRDSLRRATQPSGLAENGKGPDPKVRPS
jgi:hypothetical protein